MPRYMFKVKEEIKNCEDCPCVDSFNDSLYCNIDGSVECSDIFKPSNCPLQLVDDKGQKQADAFSWSD